MRRKPDYYYTQSAVIPYRKVDRDVEVLLISSRGKKRWVIPKGIREPSLSAAQSAAKEALEEAGIEGRVANEAVGTYKYSKWGGTCRVEVFAMEVVDIHETWPESFRERTWLSLEEAVERLDEPGLIDLFRKLARQLAIGP